MEHRTSPAPSAPAQASSGMSITRVQQWIISVLAFTVIEHFAGGLAVAAIFADDQDARVGLNVLAGVTGIVANGARKRVATRASSRASSTRTRSKARAR